jgi:hypothetical protein
LERSIKEANGETVTAEQHEENRRVTLERLNYLTDLYDRGQKPEFWEEVKSKPDEERAAIAKISLKNLRRDMQMNSKYYKPETLKSKQDAIAFYQQEIAELCTVN